MKIRIPYGVMLLVLAASQQLFANQPTLKVGDVAPKLQNGQWIQGDPVKEFQPGKAYIVEFWATWCGPCRASIPHLNEIYSKYKNKGLVVIGQDCWEHDDGLVGPFVQSMGEKMTYRVALDDKQTDPQGVMAQTWMAAADCNGIPTAFLIDTRGFVAWIGHPMALAEHEDIIDQVLNGKFDLQKAAADFTAQQKSRAQLEALRQQFLEAIKKKDWDGALAQLADVNAHYPVRDFNPKLALLDNLVQAKQYDDALQVARKFDFTPLPLLPVEQAGTLSSKVGAMPSTIVINNQTDHTLRELWISYEGKRQDYGTIPPHVVQTRLTWDTHPWLLVDEKSNSVALYIARAGGCIATIPPTQP